MWLEPVASKQAFELVVGRVLAHPHVQHFAAERVEKVRQLNERTEAVVDFKAADDEACFKFGGSGFISNVKLRDGY